MIERMFLFGLLIFSLLQLSLQLNVEKSSTRTNGLRDSPLGIEPNTNPRLSWKLVSDKRGDNQTAYQIQCSFSEDALGTKHVWDSGKVSGSEVSATLGKVVGSRESWYWRVRVWDDEDKPSAWSETSLFETALATEDWSAKWIANHEYVEGDNSLPSFSKDFEIDCNPSKARLYVTGYGGQLSYLNDKPVSGRLFEPGYSFFNQTMWYATHDVTALLNHGKNTIRMDMSNSVYNMGAKLGGRFHSMEERLKAFYAIAQLEYYCGSDRKVVGTDKSWKTTTDGPRVGSCWLGGEEYDNTLPFDKATWTNANETSPTEFQDQGDNNLGGVLRPILSPGIVKVQKFPTQRVIPLGNDSYTIDFGTNHAGVFNFSLKGKKGQRIVMWPGENITETGAVNQTLKQTGAPIFDGYTFGSDEPEHYELLTMYHGYRYLQIDNANDIDIDTSSFESWAVRTDSEVVGEFTCNVDLFNDIHTIIDRSIQSNMYSTLTDCPHREKNGWLEQNHLVFNPVAFGYDITALGDTLMLLANQSQRPSGSMPELTPDYGNAQGLFYEDPNWGNSLVVVPLQLYTEYENPEPLRAYYTSFQRHMDHLVDLSNGTNMLNFGLGDWVTIDTSTPSEIIATFGWVESLRSMVSIAELLGYDDDSEKYSKQLDTTRKTIHEKYFTSSNNSYGSGSQASIAMALDMGVVPDDKKDDVVQSLVKSCSEGGYRFTVGEIALPSLIRQLMAAGEHETLYHLMKSNLVASYGYQVEHGATSLWEVWDNEHPGIGSLNHFMLGTGDIWLTALAGGTQADGSTGWRRINYEPIVVGDLTHAKMSHQTARGLVSAEWTLNDNKQLKYVIMVPVGSQGVVKLKGKNVKESGKAIKNQKVDGSSHTITVGSGKYSFTVDM